MANDQFGLLTLFADGGFMMYPLVLCSLIALGVMIAKFWTLWAAHKDTAKVLAEVDELARAGDIDGAIAAAGSKRGPASAILMAGLRRIKGREVGEGEIEQAVSTVAPLNSASWSAAWWCSRPSPTWRRSWASWARWRA